MFEWFLQLSDSSRETRSLLRYSSNLSMAPQVTIVYSGSYRVAELLLRKGASINAVRDDGLMALELAAEGGHRPLVRLLLSRGAVLGPTCRSPEVQALVDSIKANIRSR